MDTRPLGKRMMIVAGHQPNYLPWLGYFDKMRRCDVFIIEDIVQFEYHGFTNRNRIKTRDGVRWLTVPVTRPARRQPIAEVQIANESDRRWRRRHWGTLQANYGGAPYWNDYADFFEATYLKSWTKLMDLNMHLIRGLMCFLDIDCRLVMASSLGVSGQKSDLLVAQCTAVGAETYLSGAGGRNYMDTKLFANAGISVVFQDFKYPVYRQLHGDFVPNLSVVDYLFCTGGRVWKSN